MEGEENGMKLLDLTNSEEKVIVDDEDYEYLKQWNWQLMRSSGHVGRSEYKKGTILLHRVVNNTPNELFTDHINQNKLDNRRENLRTCSKAQNSMNRAKQNGKYSSKYKGVTWCKKSQKWKARVKYNGKFIALGHHTSEIEAAKAYNQKAEELFGEFFVPNIIESEVLT